MKIDVEKSEVVMDFRKFKFIPELDKLLDYRLVLMKELQDNPDSPIRNYIETEMAGTDFLIKLQNTSQI